MDKIDVRALINQARDKAGDLKVPRVPRDKKLHFALGILAVFAAVVVAVVWDYAPGFAMTLASTAMGVGYEAQQKYRGESQFSVADAAFTSVVGWLAWGAYAAWQWGAAAL